jgi:hypothetical protein
MAQIQCPTCGEYSSDELDTCPFCQADLRAVFTPAGSEDIKVQPVQETLPDIVGEDAPEGGSKPAAVDAQTSSSAEEEVTDWLSGLEQAAHEEDQAPAWLSNLNDKIKKDESPAVSTGDDDWLNNLRESAEEPPVAQEQNAPGSDAEEPIPSTGIPDWMQKLQKDVDSRPAAPARVHEITSEEESSDTPDWLLRLQAETRAFAAAQERSLSPVEVETPDQLEQAAEVIPEPVEGDLPSRRQPSDLSMDMQSGVEEVGEQVDSTAAEMSDLTQGRPLEESTPAQLETPHEDESPDWLRPAEAGVEPVRVEENLSENGSADWLKDISPDQPHPVVLETTLENEIPTWLKEMSAEPTAMTNGGDQTGLVSMESAQEVSPDAAEPDWLINLKAEGEASQQEAGGQVKTPLDAHLDDLELVPGWLQEPVKIEPPTEPPATHQDEPVADESGSHPSGDLPDWLVTMKAEAEKPVAVQTQKEDSTTQVVLPGEIPPWVQAMQPVEAMVADAGVAADQDLSQIIENEGPLAGLQGVLPASPVYNSPATTQDSLVRLRVSDDQKRKADLLEQLLEGETHPEPATPAVKNIRSRILRWVVSLLVLISVAVPTISAVHLAPGLSIVPTEVLTTSQILFALPQSSPVLLVFDYEPAYAGELEATGSTLVANLLLSNPRLAILSTSPAGPALAEYFLRTTQNQGLFKSEQPYANLGYLAGGSTGILSFATDPSGTMPHALDGSQPWQTSLLEDVRNLSDFAALVILTDNSDTARQWVEQAGPLMGGKPVLMAISAQAEPMIRPYVESNQIQGLVSGIAGGKAYEQWLQLPGLGQRYWDSFSLGLFMAEVMIILAGLWSVISFLRYRKPAQEEEE